MRRRYRRSRMRREAEEISLRRRCRRRMIRNNAEGAE
jgi:hypothetical protein